MSPACEAIQLALSPAFALIANVCSSVMAKPNITGFDPQKFAAAAKNGTRGDPWARGYASRLVHSDPEQQTHICTASNGDTQVPSPG